MQPEREYKYYSIRRPVDAGTFPNDKDNPPIRIENYKGRIWVECNTRLAWGELVYAKPLSEKTQADYELKPSRRNPDVRQMMEDQAMVVGKWEDAKRVPERKRLTWYHPDFGVYVAKYYISPEQLAERARGVELQQAAAKRKRARRDRSGR